MKKFIAAASRLVIAGAFTALLPGAAHAASRITLGSMPAFFSGTYGTGKTIDIFYIPTYIEYRNDRLRLKLTVPYESVTGLPQGASLTGATVSSRGGQTATRSASGLGDTWLEGRYTVLKGHDLLPSLTPYAKIKFATASHAAGLGSGRNDYEIGLGLDDRAGDYAFPFAHVGYRFVGKPAGLALRNIATYDVGVSYVLPHARSNIVTAMFSGSQSEEKGYAGPADAIVAWNYNVTAAGTGIQLYVDKGLTNGSADYGVGLGGQIVF